MRRRHSLISLSAVAVAVTAAASIAGASPASASYSGHCYAYVGGDRSTGGCTGAYPDGTTFSVAEVCKNVFTSWTRTSPSTYAPPGRAVSATTAACGAGGHAVRAFIAENE